MKRKVITIKKIIPEGATAMTPFDLEHARFAEQQPNDGSNPVAVHSESSVSKLSSKSTHS